MQIAINTNYENDESIKKKSFRIKKQFSKKYLFLKL